MLSRLLGAALALALLAPTLSAQPLWRATPYGPSVSLDVLKRFPTQRFQFTEVDGEVFGEVAESFLTSAQVLSARVPVGGPWAVVAEVPLSYYALTTDLGIAELSENDGFALGNPSLGVEASVPFGEAADRMRVRAEVRLPLADGNAAFAVFGGVDPERFEAYTDRTTSLAVTADVSYGVTETLRVEARVAPVFSIVDGDRSFTTSTTNLGVLWGVHARGDLGAVSLGAGAVGRVEPEAGWLGFFDRSVTASGVAEVAVERLPVRPGLHLRVPFTEVFGSADPVVSLSLDVPLR